MIIRLCHALVQGLLTAKARGVCEAWPHGPLYLIFPLHLVKSGPPSKLTANITSLLKPTLTALGSHRTL